MKAIEQYVGSSSNSALKHEIRKSIFLVAYLKVGKELENVLPYQIKE